MSWTKLAVTGLIVVGLMIIWMTKLIWAAAFLGVLFAVSLNGPAEWIRQYVRMPTWLATLLVVLLVLLVFVGLGLIIGAPLGNQASDLIQKLPAAAQDALSWLDERPWGQRIIQVAEDWTGMSQEQMRREAAERGAPGAGALVPVSPEEAELPVEAAAETPKDSEEAASTGETLPVPDVGGIFRSTAGLVAFALNAGMLMAVTLVITIFVAFDPQVYKRGLLWLIPKQHEKIASETMGCMGVAMRWWIIGRLISMTAIGVLTSLGMWLIGMPAPLALGALAGLFSFVPNIGPVAAALPGLLLALGQGPWMVVWVLAIYLAAQMIDSNAITPLVDQYAVSVPPGVLIVMQFVLAVLAGIWGMLIATPLLVVIMVLVQQLYIRQGLKKPIEVTGST
jgi:predicted PurR-regulated permease PerM